MLLNDLHDASLIQLTLDWQAGLLTCQLDTGKGPVALVARGITKLECPRDHPWGASVSVNQVRTYASSEGVRMQIEMQSGDVIEINCSGVNLEGCE